MIHNDEPIKPLLLCPKFPAEEIRIRFPRKVVIHEYYTVSDGKKRVLKEEDGICDSGKPIILDSSELSYMNLFINGVLQPEENYTVKRGVLMLNTIDLPPKGAPVILQMVFL